MTLSNIALSQINELRSRAPYLIDQALIRYEKNIKKFNTSQEKELIRDLSLEVLALIIERVEREEAVSLAPLKQVILENIFRLNFDIELSLSSLDFFGEVIIEFLKKKQGFDKNFVQYLEEYKRLLQEATGDFKFFIETSSTELLQQVPQYAYSDVVNTYSTFDSNGYYSPLFSSDYLWENIKTRDIKPGDLVIYNKTIYKLRPNITFPNKNFFNEDEWQEYSSSRFNKTNSFNTVYSRLINSYYSKFLENAPDINGTISDSHINKYQKPLNIDSSTLKDTFGGKGDFLYDAIRKISSAGDLFGGYEGSVVGSIDYIVQFMEYFLASTRGRVVGNNGFSIVDNFDLFGKFEALFGVPGSEFRKPGLKFLDFFSGTKSFLNGKKVLDDLEIQNNINIKNINPISIIYKEGISDLYTPVNAAGPYSPPPNFDLLLLSIETLYNECLLAGDIVNSMNASLDDKGRLKGFEGFGSIFAHIYELQNAFPPSQYFSSPEAKLVGFTGSIRYLLDKYKLFSSLLIYPSLPANGLDFITGWIRLFKNTFESILYSSAALGLDGLNNFIPDISNRIVRSDRGELIRYLQSLGFRDNEAEQLLSAESFSDLIEKFAPISDSSDLKSFFKGYELSQLIYEFAGQDGIDTYLNFLYRSNDVGNLLNILDISLRDRSKTTTEAISKYPRLIGLLIGLTYAIDPQQLVKFNKILSGNNLLLLEQVTLLLQKGEDTIIKTKDEVELLGPMVDQLVQGNINDVFAAPDLNYSQANSSVPIALKNWTETISKNLGNVKSTDLIHYLYDKVEGLSIKELNYVLGGVTSNTTLGAVLDGFEGGRLTNVLKYANLAGLGVKLGFYNNSYQNNNFELKTTSPYTIQAYIENTINLIRAIDFIEIIFQSSLDFTQSQRALETNLLAPIINSQNKSLETLFGVIQSLTPESRTSLQLNLVKNLSSITSSTGNSEIAEPPGIGNSQLPNRIGVINSITPDQEEILFSKTDELSKVGIDRQLAINSLINNFIKVSEDNKLLSGINQVNETRAIVQSKSVIPREINLLEGDKVSAGPSKPSFIQISPSSSSPKQIDPTLPNIYFQDEIRGDRSIESQALGANYIRENEEFFGVQDYIKEGLITPFSRVESCKRFGGENCEQLYENEPETCTNIINKSIYSESYTEVPGGNNENLKVDRPLGTFANFVPSNRVIPSPSSFYPGFYNLLPGDNISIGENGEPLLKELYSEPILFEGESGDISEYNNTEFGLIEFINARLEQKDEFNCASFSSPYFYQLCMNVLKCKKFRPSEGKDKFLKFCPKYYSGGKLK